MSEKIEEKLNKILHDMGFIIFEDEESDDVNLQNYIIDSIQFVDFIVRIEEEFKILLPDEFLDYSNLYSMCGFGEMLEDYLESK